MLLATTGAAQTLAAGESATLTLLRQTGGPRNPPSEVLSNNAVFLRRGGLYEIGFHANVTGATAALPVELSLQFVGETLPETTSVYTPAAASAVGQISAETRVGTFSNAQSFQVILTNTGANPIDISPNGLVYAQRVG